MQINDDLILGPAAPLVPGPSALDPTLQSGPPMGRIAFYNVQPLTKGTTNVATAQHTTSGAKLTLTAGTGVTKGLAPDGSGNSVWAFDVPRAVSFTTSADMHLVSLTVKGFDAYNRPMTQTQALPSSATTANTTKAFKSILSITASATDAVNTVSVGSSDVLGLPWLVADAGYVIAKWNNTLADDAGTLVTGDATSPATASTGDPRGTYVPSSATDGSKRLVVWMHLPTTAVGPAATLAGLLGVTPV